MNGGVAPSALGRLTLPALVAQWARVVDYLERNAVSDDEYAADLLVRHEIAQRLRAKPTTLELREMLGEIDGQFRSITAESSVPVSGAPVGEGVTPDRAWYFWRVRGRAR